VLEFLVGLNDGQGRILEQAILLSFFVFKAYEAEHPGKVVTVKRKDFEVVFDQAKTWMAQLESPDMADAPAETEPFLLTYIIGHLKTPFEDGTKLTTAEQHDILLNVKTVMLALDRVAGRRSAEDS
jgi:hypothetical protein